MNGENRHVPLHRVDKYLLRVDCRETPMHTASLNVYRLPPGAPCDFMRRLLQDLQGQPVTAAPFNYRLTTQRRSRVWEVLDPGAVDLGYHVRHSAVPQPGTNEQLAALIARLHSNPLDYSRPLWEFHLIEGLASGRFASYLKMHHALADGGAVIKLITGVMSTDPHDKSSPPPWATAAPLRDAAPTPAAARHGRDTHATARATLLGTLWRTAKAYYAHSDRGLIAPYSAPRSIINGPVGKARRYAICGFDLQRIKALGGAAGCTVNDVLLTMAAGALRRYLLDHDALPARSLHAMVPVALPREPGDTLGNDVAGIYVALGTEIADVKARLAVIQESAAKGKEVLLAMRTENIRRFINIIGTQLAYDQMHAIGNPPHLMYNLLVSNVPGPRETLYFHGAQVEALYPCSVLFQGYPLNITARGYGNRINVGIVGACGSLPDFERIAPCLEEALTELEETFR